MFTITSWVINFARIFFIAKKQFSQTLVKYFAKSNSITGLSSSQSSEKRAFWGVVGYSTASISCMIEGSIIDSISLDEPNICSISEEEKGGKLAS